MWGPLTLGRFCSNFTDNTEFSSPVVELLAHEPWLECVSCCAGERVETIVHEGAVDALVPQLHAPIVDEGEGPVACEHEVEKDTAFALGLLAVKVSKIYKLSWQC